MLSDGGMKVPYLRHGMASELRFSTYILSAVRRTLWDLPEMVPYLRHGMDRSNDRFYQHLLRRTAERRMADPLGPSGSVPTEVVGSKSQRDFTPVENVTPT